MATNNFKPRKYYDFEIVNPKARMVGSVRIKPSGVLWAPAFAKVWYGVPLEKFANFMEREGKQLRK